MVRCPKMFCHILICLQCPTARRTNLESRVILFAHFVGWAHSEDMPTINVNLMSDSCGRDKKSSVSDPMSITKTESNHELYVSPVSQ